MLLVEEPMPTFWKGALFFFPGYTILKCPLEDTIRISKVLNGG